MKILALKTDANSHQNILRLAQSIMNFVQCSVPHLAVGRTAMRTNKLRKIGLGGVSGVRILSWVSNLREKDGLKNKTRILFIHSFIHSFIEKTVLQFRKSTLRKSFHQQTNNN